MEQLLTVERRTLDHGWLFLTFQCVVEWLDGPEVTSLCPIFPLLFRSRETEKEGDSGENPLEGPSFLPRSTAQFPFFVL